jgi:Ras family protein T1
MFLQLQEFGSKYEDEMLRNSKKTDVADVVVYVHDSSDTNSFSYISNLRVGATPCIFMKHARMTSCVKQQYSLDHIPTLFVATKSDLDLALQVSKFPRDISELWMLSLDSAT